MITGSARRDHCTGFLDEPSTTEEGDAVEKLTVLEAYRAGKLSLPPGYELQFDADMILLRRD